jgi:O-antigen ligase
VLAAAASPVWPTSYGPVQLTVGRVLVVVLALAVLADLVPVRGHVARPRWAVAGLILALGALAGWAGVSAATRGCVCSGTLQGFAELSVMTGLAGVVGLYASPRWALAAMGAAALGALAGGTLAAVGLRDLHAAVFAPGGSVGRLEGVYGNPNFLGTALALALPTAAAGAVRLRGGWRWAALATALALAGLLLATFSRGSLLAAAVGVPVALAVALGRRPSRRLVVATAIGIPLLAGAVFVSPFYRTQRLRADFGAAKVASVASIDRSGWFSGRAGPVRRAGSVLSNPPGTQALRVDTTRAGQGVSLDLGAPFDDAHAEWRFTVAQGSRVPPLDVHWQVATDAGGAVAHGITTLRSAPRTVAAGFPATRGGHYLVYAWTVRPATFAIYHVGLFEKRPGSPGSLRALSTRLEGPAADSLHAAEGDYVRSRWTGVRLAVAAFAAHPIAGLGLNRFPEYADAHARYGELPTHNTYAQVLAELGVVGVLALAAVLAVLAAAWSRGRPPALLRAALGGTLVAGAVNLLLINGLSSPGMAMPLILAMGFSAAWAGPAPPRLRTRWDAAQPRAARSSS